MSNKNRINPELDLSQSFIYIRAIYHRLFHDFSLTGPGENWKTDRENFRRLIYGLSLPTVNPTEIKNKAIRNLAKWN